MPSMFMAAMGAAMTDLRAHARAQAARQRAAQGLPPTVRDPLALDRLAQLVSTDSEPESAQDRSARAA